MHGKPMNPPGQMPPPGGRPCGHPTLKSIFSHLISIHAMGFTTQCIAKLNLLLNITLLLAKAKVTDLDHYQPFLLSLPGFCLHSSSVQMSGASKSWFINIERGDFSKHFLFLNIQFVSRNMDDIMNNMIGN